MLPLSAYPAPGLFITATNTDVGKTTATAVLAAALHSLGKKVGILKPIASGCPKFPHRGNNPDFPLADDDLIPLDVFLPAQSLNLDIQDETLLSFMSPLRYAAPVSPALAAELESRPADFSRVQRALDYWRSRADLLLVEGAGGWLTPLDAQDHMIADIAAALKLPVILVTTPGLGSINATLLTIESIRARKLEVAGLIINNVPPLQQQDLAIQSNLKEIPRLAGVPLLGLLPRLEKAPTHPLPAELMNPLLPFASSLLR